MPNNSLTQQALAADKHFQRRVRSCIANVAWQVLSENPSVPNHDARVAYARRVISSIETAAMSIASWLVERPNLLAFETSYDFSATAVVTAAGDPDIQSQLMSDWDVLAPPVTGPAAMFAPPSPIG